MTWSTVPEPGPFSWEPVPTLSAAAWSNEPMLSFPGWEPAPTLSAAAWSNIFTDTWLLSGGLWKDGGVWDDRQFWLESSPWTPATVEDLE